MSTTLFVIMCTPGSVPHKQSDKLKRQLLGGGAGADRVHVADGRLYGETEQNGEQIRNDGICHFSFVYRWLPKTAGLLAALPQTTCVMYLEQNARLDVDLSSCFLFLRMSQAPVAWLGYRSLQAWDVIQGSKCIAFTGDSLVHAHDAVRCGRGRGWHHLDGVLSRRLDVQIAYPSSSFFGVREHSTVSEGDGAVLRRPAQATRVKKRTLERDALASMVRHKKAKKNQ